VSWQTLAALTAFPIGRFFRSALSAPELLAGIFFYLALALKLPQPPYNPSPFRVADA